MLGIAEAHVSFLCLGSIVEFPLHYAVIMWDVKGIEAMLKDKQSRGAAMVNTPDDQGHTPLQYLLITGDSLSWHPYTGMPMPLTPHWQPNETNGRCLPNAWPPSSADALHSRLHGTATA